MVILGDGGVGKTAITIQFCLKHFVETYDPTIEDSYRKQVTIDGQSCMLEVLDTAGQEEYTSLRDQWIRSGEGFLLIYSITSRSSFARIPAFYNLIEKVKYDQTVAVILVGNKSDCVAERQVSYAEGAKLAEDMGIDFIETSSKIPRNVDEAFFKVVRQIRKLDGSDQPSSSNAKKRKDTDLSDGERLTRKKSGLRCIIL